MIIEVYPGSGGNGDEGKPGYLTIIEWKKVAIAAFSRW